MAKIEVSRSKEYANRIRNIRLLIDDNEIGTIKNGETREFDVTPGEHILQAKIDWCSSNKLSFNASPDRKKSFNMTSFAKHNPLGVFATIYYITFGSNKYLHLEEKTI